jgi:hypothetical protein
MLLKDVEGLCSLYEASQLAFEGETFLDEARNVCTKALIELMPSMYPHKRHFVARASDTHTALDSPEIVHEMVH